MPKKKLVMVLASASPRRKKLLKKIVKKFKIVTSQVKETKIKANTPLGFAVKAALAKAEDVAKKQKDALVVGADTIVVLGNKILGKPKTKKEAVAMLKSLAGKTHQVITGIAVVDTETGEKATDYEITKVKMKKVTDQNILDYVASGKPMDKAGAYGIQEIEQSFGINIKGDYDNVVGLPVKKLKSLIQYVKVNK
ncbi:septum formation protein Maf [candidate division WOR-1 bacterium RIFOXYB2_FULL_42_35]|uniref:dTTP/UTP pyrophosphatase n=1 Tax=candidate division WOR-1 bacterium RIFOXYC2_FULL_41_25 TaxID=1802586 RepID=A0A1F4TRA7_UNCSA|nr:MAG: septum formation protein Maf [candidate division WOR-1 bacterium RIFOXYA2_FULL_41_14]OGC25815.1 MAG: septum formation protein Maf [candidate division WOR-1 bacterium RIFOXYB2_FULL_42_35]OGC35255.1 MAG: septum formation protein Maf [candidate division WOR-1 bacterium RIFOXYC2_FULL_41_25]